MPGRPTPRRHHADTMPTPSPTPQPGGPHPDQRRPPTPRTRQSPIASTLTNARAQQPRDNVDSGQRRYEDRAHQPHGKALLAWWTSEPSRDRADRRALRRPAPASQTDRVTASTLTTVHVVSRAGLVLD